MGPEEYCDVAEVCNMGCFSGKFCLPLVFAHIGTAVFVLLVSKNGNVKPSLVQSYSSAKGSQCRTWNSEKKVLMFASLLQLFLRMQLALHNRVKNSAELHA